MQDCLSCDLDALSASGVCMPGSYNLTYSVTNDEGITATASRQLMVYQAATITSSITLYTDLGSYSEVLDLVAGLQNVSSPTYAAGIERVITKLGSLAGQIEPGDVDITGVGYEQGRPQHYSVHVNATVHVYVPKGVHRQAVLAANSLQQDPGTHMPPSQTRRLLQDAVQPASTVAAIVSGGTTGGTSGTQQPDRDHVRELKHSLALLEELTVAGSGGSANGALNDYLSNTYTSSSKGPTRQLLQASAAGHDLASVLAGLAGQLGPNITKQLLTPQSVDLTMVSDT